MGLLVVCSTIENAEKILEALFDIILSKYDGFVENSETLTPCYKAKRYLQSLITTTNITNILEKTNGNDYHDVEEEENVTDTTSDNDITDNDNIHIMTFKGWTQSIADRSRAKVDSIKGTTDNAQYLLALEPIIIRTLKLFPCWSAIMIDTFGYGEEIASSSRIESNFNHIKNRVIKNDKLPIRVDSFVEKLLSYYRGNELLIQGESYGELETDVDENICNSNSYSSNTQNIIRSPEHGNYDDTLYNMQNDFDVNESLVETEPASLHYIPISKDIIVTSTTDKCQSTLKSTCHACNNGDFPTGAHKCIECNKPIHLFGCSISIQGTEEGYGECRICFDCDKIKSTLAETNATENWNRKSMIEKKKRSSRSYLNLQPGFEFLDLNKRGNITPVVLLKNGNSLINKPIMVPSVGKVVLNNTCSVDSVLSILATSAADSSNFKVYLSEMATSNMTARISMKMIEDKNKTQIYHNRLLLILEHFGSKIELLVGGLKSVDTTITAASMVNKIMQKMPSFIESSFCDNNLCTTPILEVKKTHISLNIFNGQIVIQNELEKLFESSDETCSYCGEKRKTSMEATTHMIIELNSIPFGKYNTNN
ncbi:unnamed protein product [Macrosiphum euphorbiae]|uniref:SCAN domain-containing protein n=1 Tax=Macrosiphum euphorbiae TaxID=13131 RepID=A0AAV0XRV2_9HEMI|nr:unnamed protein product [Macrosiphum euphorbiae]